MSALVRHPLPPTSHYLSVAGKIAYPRLTTLINNTHLMTGMLILMFNTIVIILVLPACGHDLSFSIHAFGTIRATLIVHTGTDDAAS